MKQTGSTRHKLLRTLHPIDPTMNILIIGAGAAGLMAGHLLAKAGHHITILEAKDRIGGRICTSQKGAFSKPASLGAEFVHGKLPLTLSMLDEAGSSYNKCEGEMWHFGKGHFYREDPNGAEWPLLMERLAALQQDIPIRHFLEKEFPGSANEGFRKSVEGLVMGMDAADPEAASAFALGEEWIHEAEGDYRIDGGYGGLIKYLSDSCVANGAVIHTKKCVKEIRWSNEGVRVTIKGDEVFEADKVLITVPIGVLQAPPTAEAGLSFIPAIPKQQQAINELGSGNAIKILLQFREPIWLQHKDQDLRQMSFLLTSAAIPTWWTQFPEPSAMLTGWVGGPQAHLLKDHSAEELLGKALASLSEIFSIPVSEISTLLDAYEVANWPADPFSLGSYSYATVATKKALAILKEPAENTIYFAGEAMYDGPAMGTVEAALTSARETAAKILQEENLEDYKPA